MSEDSYSYYLKGNEALEKGQTEEAVSYYKKSLKLSQHYKTYYKLYECCSAIGQYDMAFHYLESAYLLNKKSDKTAAEYAAALSDKGRADEARTILIDTLKRNPCYKKAAEMYNNLSEKFYPCPCCGYRTLTEKYDPEKGTGYDICPYCGWEDDGTAEDGAYSSANRGRMTDYRKRIRSDCVDTKNNR